MKKLGRWLLRGAFGSCELGTGDHIESLPWLGDMACSEGKERGRGLPESC